MQRKPTHKTAPKAAPSDQRSDPLGHTRKPAPAPTQKTKPAPAHSPKKPVAPSVDVGKKAGTVTKGDAKAAVASATGDKKGGPYGEWKKLKDMRLGSRSKRVWLLQHPKDAANVVVLKMYDAADAHHRGRFAKEIAVLRRLKDCPFVPKLLHIDKKRCAMWITYCGPVAKLTPDVKAQVEHHLREMASKWRVFRVTGKEHTKRYDAESIFEKNICIKDGVVRCIDFGSNSWLLEPM